MHLVRGAAARERKEYIQCANFYGDTESSYYEANSGLVFAKTFSNVKKTTPCHLRIDLTDGKLSRFALNEQLWEKAKRGVLSLINGIEAEQLNQLIEQMKKDPFNRRLVVSNWDPEKAFRSPEYVLFQFITNDENISCCVFQHRATLGSDLPYFSLLFSLLNHLVASIVDIPAGELIYFITKVYKHPSSLEKFPSLDINSEKLVPKLRLTKKVERLLDFTGREILLVKEEQLEFKKEGLRKEEGTTDEMQYLSLVQTIISCPEKPNRTGINTRALVGARMRFSLRDGVIPVLTTKRIFWRGVLEELLWFVKGSTNAKELSEKNVHIWDDHSSRQFLDSQGFKDREEGDLGPVYGFQWRHFGAEYGGMKEDYTGKGVDQLKEVIEKVKSDPDNDGLIVTAWNVKDIKKMALPPCHLMFQFYVCDGELSCCMYQRSADMGLGVPFNIASYSLLTHMVAHVTGLKAGEFVHCIGDAHVYSNHVESLEEQLKRNPRPFPKLVIKRQVVSIDDFKSDDFQLVCYNPHPNIKMEMAV